MLKKRDIKADTLFQSVTVAIALAIVCRFVAFGRGVFLARVLEPEELGTWALMANAIQVLAFVCALGIPNGLTRYSERHRTAGTLKSFFLGAITRAVAVAFVVILIGLIFWKATGDFLFSDSSSFAMVGITLIAILVTVLLTLGQGMLQGLRLFRMNSLFELGQNLSFLILAMFMVGFWRTDAYAAAWANMLATLFIAVGIGLWLKRSLKTEPTNDSLPQEISNSWKVLFAFSLGAWSAGSCQAMWRVIDRYMLLHLSSLDSSETLDHIGQYFIASKLGQPLGALAAILSMALLPHAVKFWENNKRTEVGDMIRMTTKLAAIVMTFGGAVLIMFKSELVTLITGRSADLAVLVFVPVLVTIIAVSLHYILRTYLMCDERAWSLGGIWLATLLANIGLNVVLIPKYGLAGAAWATMLSAAVAVSLVALLSTIRGMRLGMQLIGSLTIPLVLCLPSVFMLIGLLIVACLVYYSEIIFTKVEKESVNQQCFEKFGHLKFKSWQLLQPGTNTKAVGN